MEQNTKKRMRFQLLVRLVSRASEIAARPEMTKEGKWVYSELLAPAAETFCKDHEAVVVAESTVAQKNQQVRRLESEFESVDRTARSIVLAFAPTTKLPNTVKAQRTDTDKLLALATLVSVVKAHAGEPWADALLEGQFGTLAPKMEAALKEAIAANDALETARNQRLAAYGPAYAGYIAFKRVVRNLLGSSSRAYRRLHPRASVPGEIEADEPAEEAAPDSGVMPASNGTQAPAGDLAPVKIA